MTRKVLRMTNLYNLYYISEYGYYPVIQGSVPSADIYKLTMIKGYIHEIKPGHGEHYLLEIIQVDKDSTMSVSEYEKIIAARQRLSSLNM